MDGTALFVIILAVYFTSIGVVYARRRASMRALASRLGFRYFGEAYPATDILLVDPLLRISATSNFIEGERDGIQVVAFDCRVGRGKGSSATTVLAAKSGGQDVFCASCSIGDLTTDHSGSWVVLQRTHLRSFFPRFIPVEELEAQITSIRR
jgi:hypothetical protein